MMKFLLTIGITLTILGIYNYADAAITFVQVATTTSSGTAISTATSNLTVTAGDTLFALVGINNASTFTGAGDSLGNTWTLDAKISNGSNDGIAIWRASNVVGGVDVVSSTVSAAGSQTMLVAEYSGLATVAGTIVDTSSTGANTGVYTSAGTITTASSSDLILMDSVINGNTGDVFTASSSFIKRQQQENGVGGKIIATEDRILSVTTTTLADGSWAGNTGSPVVAAAVAYRATPAVVSVAITQPMTFTWIED